jgi:hypothetical protein
VSVKMGVNSAEIRTEYPPNKCVSGSSGQHWDFGATCHTNWIERAQGRVQWRCFVTTREVEAKLSLCLTKHHVMKTYGGVEV